MDFTLIFYKAERMLLFLPLVFVLEQLHSLYYNVVLNKTVSTDFHLTYHFIKQENVESKLTWILLKSCYCLTVLKRNLISQINPSIVLPHYILDIVHALQDYMFMSA